MLFTSWTKAIRKFSFVLWSSVSSACGSAFVAIKSGLLMPNRTEPALSNSPLPPVEEVNMREGEEVKGPALPVS